MITQRCLKRDINYICNCKNSKNDQKFEDEILSLPNVCTTPKKDRNLRIYN